MDNVEFSSQFDILYNNISSNAAPPIDEYEKSVFLTLAQKDIVLSLYNGREIPGMSFESTEESRRYLANLVKSFETSLDNNASDISLPEDLWFIVRESGVISSSDECLNNKELMIVPVKQDELSKILNNPFKGPNAYRALREDFNGKIKLHSKYNISKYKADYIKFPEPIITDSLEGLNLTIDGKTESSTDVDKALHMSILKRAVELAKEAYIGNNKQ